MNKKDNNASNPLLICRGFFSKLGRFTPIGLYARILFDIMSLNRSNLSRSK